ncbi:ribosome biogenesis factor YjgA [Ferrimonas senticii]|uniref:ribosome biogenesis factor YjgA n=1 Tax=Ferrimonas senticii TaxID=394566 RepID=UPI0004102317|nr:ribosome biogenesis factor YjgA [Ferrimonas senticii]
MNDYEDFDDELISKSQLKREAESTQRLGEKLLDLSPGQLAKVPLDDDLLAALELANRIRGKHEAYRRQRQYIGKLMRARDPEPIEEALKIFENESILANQRFHMLEQLRDQLLTGSNEALQHALNTHPALNSELQRLRQLIRQAVKEAAANKPPKAARELFKLLRYTLLDK